MCVHTYCVMKILEGFPETGLLANHARIRAGHYHAVLLHGSRIIVFSHRIGKYYNRLYSFVKPKKQGTVPLIILTKPFLIWYVHRAIREKR